MPNHTLFIADLHLDESHRETTHFFDHFVDNVVIKADALYILGDLFEVWVGDDDKSAFNESIKHRLKKITNLGIPVYFMHGNRDFMIGRKFFKATGCKRLPQPSVINLYGQKLALLHGDSLCTLDVKHMKSRKLTENRFLRWLVAFLPLETRKRLGKKFRNTSQTNTQKASASIMDVVESSVSNFMEKHQVKTLVHGHTHRPNIHNFLIKEQPAQRIVLGSWEKQGCALKWYSDGQKELVFFP